MVYMFAPGGVLCSEASSWVVVSPSVPAAWFSSNQVVVGPSCSQAKLSSGEVRDAD